MQKVRQPSKELTFIKTCLLGVGLAELMAVLIAMLFAALISSEYIEFNFSQYAVPVVIFIAVVLGSLTAGKLATQKHAQACIVVGFAFLILQCCAALLFFEGISTSFFAGFISCLLGCVVSIFLCVARKKRAKVPRSRKRYR